MSRINDTINTTNIPKYLKRVHHCILILFTLLYGYITNSVKKYRNMATCQIQTGVIKGAAFIEPTRLATKLSIIKEIRHTNLDCYVSSNQYSSVVASYTT